MQQACFLTAEGGQIRVKANLLQKNPTENIWKLSYSATHRPRDDQRCVWTCLVRCGRLLAI